jgi:hypothetical protein
MTLLADDQPAGVIKRKEPGPRTPVLLVSQPNQRKERL